MRYQYNSHFAEDIYNYIQLKIALGYSASSYDHILYTFDKFCLEYYPNTHCLTKEIVDKWCCLRKGHEHENGLHRRMIALKGFASYLRIIGKDSYVIPDGSIGKDTPFIPYIFTDDELQKFFVAADHLPWNHSAKDRQYIVPIIFRVLFCCGLRPNEVLVITCSDVNFKNGTIYISDSKSHKDRLVPMSPEVVSICRCYDNLMNHKYPKRNYFFGQDHEKPYSINWLQRQFWRCWKEAGITFSSTRRPRVYDWRHTFATHVIMNWLNESKDIEVMLPYLSQYMGHTKLEDTLYYVHLIPERMSASGLTDWNSIPEVPIYED